MLYTVALVYKTMYARANRPHPLKGVEMTEWLVGTIDLERQEGIVRGMFQNKWNISLSCRIKENGTVVIRSMEIKAADVRKTPEDGLSVAVLSSENFQTFLNDGLKVFKEEVKWLEDESDYLAIQYSIQQFQWESNGPKPFDSYMYAAVGFMYLKFIQEGIDQPVMELARFMKCERATASARLAKARNLGFLTSNKTGSSGGALTAEGKKILNQGGGEKNAKESKPNTRRVKKK